jgi:hypothetical protein
VCKSPLMQERQDSHYQEDHDHEAGRDEGGDRGGGREREEGVESVHPGPRGV